MPARRFLYLTSQQLAAYSWHAGRLHEEASFETSDAGNGFVAYLQQYPKSIFSMVVNIPEEGFQVDSIPFLQAGDRKTVIERKLGQLYQGAPLAIAIPLGFEKTRRKDERLLFTALNNPALFEPWLTALTTAETRLAGIYSLPVLSEALIERLHLPKERCLLITVQDNSIRQTFFDNGHMHFSRLSPLANSSISGIAQSIAADTSRTQQYLLGQRHVSRTDALSVHILAHAQAISAVSAACAGSETLRFQIHDINDLAAKLGLKTPPEDSRADRLFLQTAAAAPPRHQFAREAQRQSYRLWQTANALIAAGTVAFVGCAVFVGKEAFDVVSLRNRVETAQTTATLADQRYQAIAQTFPPLPISHDTLRQVTGKYDEIAGFASGPGSMYQVVSRAVTLAPQIEIESIDWKLSGLPGARAEATPGTAPAAGAARGTAADSPAESATVRGWIQTGPRANPREILRSFEAFVDQLKATPRMSVSVVQQPFDLGTEKAVKSKEGANAMNAPRAFAVTISRKPGT